MPKIVSGRVGSTGRLDRRGAYDDAAPDVARCSRDGNIESVSSSSEGVLSARSAAMPVS